MDGSLKRIVYRKPVIERLMPLLRKNESESSKYDLFLSSVKTFPDENPYVSTLLRYVATRQGIDDTIKRRAIKELAIRAGSINSLTTSLITDHHIMNLLIKPARAVEVALSNEDPVIAERHLNIFRAGLKLFFDAADARLRLLERKNMEALIGSSTIDKDNIPF